MAAYSTYTDQELTVLLKQGDGNAFTEIYDRYWTALYLHGRKLLRDDVEAEDVVQDLFVQLWNNREMLSFNVALSSYLYRSTRNKILNQIAHKKIVTDYQRSLAKYIEEGKPTTDELLREKELALLIEHEITLLPPKMREVFEMSRKQHLSYKQIGEILGISDETVRRQVSNALAVLRTKLYVSGWMVCYLLMK